MATPWVSVEAPLAQRTAGFCGPMWSAMRPALASAAMTSFRRLLFVLSALLLALLLAAVPAAATEAGGGEETPAEATEGATEGEEGGEPAGAEESSRVSFPSRPHDQVGLLLTVLLIGGGGAALYNARKQLRGERTQATGEFRWR